MVRPLLGARSGEAECEKPPDQSSASSRRPTHHDPLQQGPFLWALGRSQEQGTPGQGWGRTPGPEVGCRAPPRGPWDGGGVGRASPSAPCFWRASRRGDVGAARESPRVPDLSPTPSAGSRALFWLCSSAAGRDWRRAVGSRAPGIPQRLPSAPGAGLRLQDAPFREGGAPAWSFALRWGQSARLGTQRAASATRSGPGSWPPLNLFLLQTPGRIQVCE